MLLVNNKELTYHENYLDHYNSSVVHTATSGRVTGRKSSTRQSDAGLYSSGGIAGSGSTSSSSGGGGGGGGTNSVHHRNVIVSKSKKQRELVVEYEC